MSRRPCSAALLAACAVLAGAPQPAAADPDTSTSYPAGPAEFSLSVSPTRLVVDRPGTATTREMLVVNRGRAPVEVVAEKRDFTGGRDGSLVFQRSSPYSASSWIGLAPTRFRLPPGAAQAVSVRIVVPPDPEPGDHQVALVFVVPATAQDARNVRINRAVACARTSADAPPIVCATHSAGLPGGESAAAPSTSDATRVPVWWYAGGAAALLLAAAAAFVVLRRRFRRSAAD